MADASTTTTKVKKPRNAAKGPRQVFVVFQVLDEAGVPMEFNKDRIVLVKATRNAAKALVAMDDKTLTHATYKAVTVEDR